jgi:outer membrane immunogenic protein
VYGFEVDAWGGSINGRSREMITPYFGPGTSISLRTSECVDFIGTLGGRLGYARDQVLFYGTAGAAVANVNTRLSMMDSFGFDAKASNDSLRGGYFVGAGVEFKATQRMSVLLEYRYIDLGENRTIGQEFLGAVPAGSSIANTTRLDYQVIRTGINVKFDGGGTSLFMTPR